MNGGGSDTLGLAARQAQLESLGSLIRELEANHDVEGLAVVAEMSLFRLRQLCERAATCEELDVMLKSLARVRPTLLIGD